MKLGTFDKPDYIAIGPYAWARAKDPREAYKKMLSNMPSFVKKETSTAVIWRLTDATDTVRVDDTGNFNVDSGELPFHCLQVVVGMPAKYIPETFHVPGAYKAERATARPLHELFEEDEAKKIAEAREEDEAEKRAR